MPYPKYDTVNRNQSNDVNKETDISDIIQVDGNESIASETSVESNDDSSGSSDFETEDEAFPDIEPVHLSPILGQNNVSGEPLIFDVDMTSDLSSSLPLCLLLNARSVCNKSDNLKEMLHRICPDICLVSETFERTRKRLRDVLNSRIYKSISYYRKNRAPGGGCAIIYKDTRFSIEDLEVPSLTEIENVWALATPKHSDTGMNFKRIAIGSYYVSPKSRHKKETIEHIIDTIHILRAKYSNEVNFLIGGDFNHLDTTDILDSYGALHSIISVPTRNSATLEIILTDLHTLFHPPTTLPPLQVDSDKQGKDSDHNVVVLAPKQNTKYRTNRKKKTIKSRPLPESQILKFEDDLMRYLWDEALQHKSVNEQVDLFHNFLRSNLEKYFPEKTTKMSSLDREWMNPELKNLNRAMKREFFRHRKSQKYKQLKSKFKKLKRKTLKTFYSEFVCNLKKTDPAKWYQMAKKIGAVDKISNGETRVECLSHLSNKESAQKIAEHFASVSNEYMPIDNLQLPAYLPALPVPQVEEYDVYVRINKLKKSKSTLPIDIPERLRRQCSPHLASPLTTIINNCLTKSEYPALWKHEWVTPAPKITDAKLITDLRKISSTSDYSKIFEGFLKDWIMEDVCDNIDIGQYGGQPGIGTEHMIVCLIDRILQLLDTYPDKSAVIAANLDWSAAFDRQDPTLGIDKLIKLGVRASLIPLLVSYLSDRKMQVKFNNEVSELLTLIGGGPQGTLVGGIEYLAQSNDNADIVRPEDRFK